MKILKKIRAFTAIGAVALLGTLPQQVVANNCTTVDPLDPAACSQPNDLIANTASLTYNDGSGDVTVLSNSEEFRVDTSYDLLVAPEFNQTYTPVAVDSSPNIDDANKANTIRFDVTNQSNTDIDVLLLVFNSTQDPADPADGAPTGTLTIATDVAIYLDTDGNGFPDGAPVTSLNDLEPGESRAVYVAADLNGSGLTGGQTLAFTLNAQVADAATGGVIAQDQSGNVSPAPYNGVADPQPDGRLTVETLFTDGAGINPEDTDSTNAAPDVSRNGQSSNAAAFRVAANAVLFSKSSSVRAVGPNASLPGGAGPKAVPGSTIRYALEVDNVAGAADAVIVLTDDIPAGTTYLPGSIEWDDGDDVFGAGLIPLSDDNDVGDEAATDGTPGDHTDATKVTFGKGLDPDSNGAGNTVTVQAGTTDTFYFRVTVD